MKKEKDDKLGFEPVTNGNLVCIDCDFAYSNPQLVSVCEKFPDIKPSKVLYGGECDEHKSNK